MAGGEPRIFVAEESMDLGRVESGEILKKSATIGNKGTGDLVIDKIEPSCGCTVANLTSWKLLPGESAVLEFMVDTHGKIGSIVKQVSVYSNDPVEPLKVITLSFTAAAPGHHEAEMFGKHIFQGKCRGCHVDRGEGLSGGPLFEADCAMCHRGKDAEYSPGLPVEALRTLSEEELRGAIQNGVPGTSMPGYQRSVGGPLDSEQTESLIRYLRRLEQ